MQKKHLPILFEKGKNSPPSASGFPSWQRLWAYSLLLTLGILCQSNLIFAQMGKSINLNGYSSTDYIAAPSGVYFNGDFTVEGWVYVRSYGPAGRLFDFGNGQANNNVLVHFNPSNGTVRFYSHYLGGTFTYFDSYLSVPLNQWAHVAVTMTGTTATIYINGQFGGSNSAMIAPPNVVRTSCRVGASNWGEPPIDAKMDEFRIWNLVRTQEQIQENMNRTLTGNEPGLQLYYNMETIAANGQNQSVADVAATAGGAQNGNTVGTLTTPTNGGLDASPPAYGNVLQFDGANDYISIPNNTGAWNTFGSAMTIEAWVNPEYTSVGHIISKDNNGGAYSFALRYNAASIEFYTKLNGTYAGVTIPRELTPLKQWSHIAGVYNGTQMLLYVNGVQVGSANYTGTIDNNVIPIHIGAQPNVGQYYSGSLDELRVWNVARTQAQIAANMTSVPANSAGLVAYYPFDQGVGGGTNTGLTACTDVSANAYNGVLQTFTLTGLASNWEARSTSVTTPTQAGITGTTAVLGATYTQAVPDFIEKGVVFGTAASVSLTTGRKALSSGNTSGAFTTAATNLFAGTKYYYKGYVYTNSVISYTAVDSFTTPYSTNWGNALDFDGVNDHFYLTNGVDGYPPAIFNTFGSAITLESWIKPSANVAASTIIAKRNNGGGVQWSWILRVDNGVPVFYVRGGGAYSNVFSSQAIPLNQWSHIAGVYDGANMKIYVNGVLMGTLAKTGAIDNTNLQVGLGASYGFGEYLAGTIDELRVWNTARTQAQIQASLGAPIPANTAGLVTYFPFDQGIANANNASVNFAFEATNNYNTNNLVQYNFALNGSTSNWVSRAATFAAGNGNNVLDFDGVNDFVIIPSANINNKFAANQISLEGWFNCQTFSGAAVPMLIGDGYSDNTIRFTVHQEGNGIRAGFYTPANNWVNTPIIPIQLNAWQHVAATYDQVNLKLYINGVLVSTVASTLPLPPSTTDWYIGKRWDYAEVYKGQLDEIRVWNVARSQAEIVANMQTSVSAVAPNLVAYYPFNQGISGGINSSVNTAIDATANANTGALTNFALTGGTSNWVSTILPANANNAIDLDGVNDFVQVPAGNYFGGGNFTVESWVYPRSFGNYSRIMDFGIGQTNNNVLLTYSEASNGYPNLQVHNGATVIGAVLSSVPLQLNQWAHIAATVSGNTATMYINGQKVGSTTLTGVVPNISLPNCYVGRSNWPADPYPNALLDEFRIWSVARTQAQIQASMNKPVAANSPGLTMYYPFNQGIASGNNTSITTATDVSPSGLHATLQNIGLVSTTSNFVWGNAQFNYEVLPTLTNILAGQATMNSASSTPTNGASISSQGFIYNAGTAIPTLATSTKIASSSMAVGAYSATPTGLAENQLYSVRAFITTANGTVLSGTTTFKTTFCRVYPQDIRLTTTPTTASVTWTTDTTGATTYSWRVVATGAGASGTAVVNGTSNAATLAITGLSAGKDYDLHLRITGGCTTSTWSDARPFSTKEFYVNTLSFDGTNDHVILGNVSQVNALTAAMTIETWARPSGIAGTDMIFNKEVNGSGIKLALVNGIPTATIFTTVAVSVAAPAALPINQWAHLAATYNGTKLTLYLNGTAVNSVAATGNLTANAGTAYIGRAVAAGTYYQGMLDEFRVWNVARSQTQLRAGMASGLSQATAGLIMSYNFDQGTPNGANTIVNTLADGTASAVTGTLTGFTLTGNSSNWIARAPYLAARPTATAISSSGATFNGNLLKAGTGTVTLRGFIYVQGLNVPTFDLGTKITAAGTGVGGFLMPVTGLTLGQIYSFRSYVLTADGYSFSDTASFLVNPCSSSPTLSSITASNITSTGATFSWTTLAPSYDWVLAASGYGVTTPVFSGSSATGSVVITGLEIGKNYDFFLRSNCGAIVSPWRGVVTIQTLSTPTFTTTTPANDAYIDVNWTLHPLPCLISAGVPYSQGVYVKLTDVTTGQTIFQEPINNLTPYIGAQQPAFTFVAGDSSNNFGETVNNTNNWQNFNSSTWTVETWIKGNINSSNAELFRASLVNDIYIKVSGSTIAIQKNASTINFNTPLPLGKWKHLAFACDGGNVSLFIDGVKKEQKAISNLAFGGGAAAYSIANNMVGVQMGEIRYWNRVRTDVEIADNRFVTAFTGLGQNNLLLHWRWNSANAHPTDLATTYDGQNNTAAYTGIGVLPTLNYITTPDYTAVVGTFRHHVGPTQNRNYKLEVFKTGTGAPVGACTNLTTTGSTISFQQPTNGTASTDSLSKVRLSWTNKSKLSESYKIFRNGTLRSVIAGSGKIDSVFVWNDVYSETDSNSIANGTSYNYCIETYYNTLNMALTPQLCLTGNTFNLNFAASDNVPTNQVNMTWANVAAYGYAIQIKREGILLATLPASATTYTDPFPIYGKNAKYEMVLYNATTSDIIVGDNDLGGVPARGAISGRVVTFENNYAIKNARIKLHSLVDTTIHLTTYTDFQGNFAFSGLYYADAGDFDLTADYGNHIIIDKTQTISLSDAAFTVSNVVFYDSTGFTINATPLAVTNFGGTIMPTLDKINFVWNFTVNAGDTVLYDIYRESKKIATLTSLTNALAYSDLGGEPNVNYEYTLNAYKTQNGIITAAQLLDTLIFPAVTMTTGFAAVPSVALGVVNLTWSHTSANYSGFRIYRNGMKVADLAPGVFAYTDKDAQPGTTATYILKAKRFVNNITFESFGQTVTNVAIPALPPVTGMTATANPTRNSVIVNWTIPAGLPIGYNYDGFRIYRKTATGSNVYIGQLPKAINPPFEDKSGVPGISYIYSVKTYLRLPDNSISESNGVSATRAFPVVTIGSGLAATTNLSGEVNLTWTPPANTIKNIDGQLVIRGVDTLAVLSTGATSFRAFTNTATTATYNVRTFRVINGVKYCSLPISANGKSLAGITSPEYATNVKASQNLPNHVRVSWDYPSYVLSTFKVYRDNVLLTTLPTETRVYLDNTAVKGTNHLYQIEATNANVIGQKAGAWGSLKSIYELSGMVNSATDKYGVPGVDVYASAPNFSQHTKTDSSGFYVFTGLPQTVGTSVNVAIDGYGTNHTATFVPSNQTFAITTSGLYTQNFGSSYTPATTDSLAPSRPMNIIATPIPARRRMAVSWTASNTFYEGFEVYRANVLLGTILKGTDFLVYDTQGYPGISYTYQIRSYQYTDNTKTTKKYSAFYSTTGIFPDLESPLYVAATPNLALNTLKINWSHNWDNHTRYQITRNDSVLTTVNTGAVLEYTDISGVPGQQYVYGVKAIMVVGGKTHLSTEATISVQYPAVAEVGNLTATSPTSSTSYATPCSTNVTQERNFVDLNWTYPPTAYVKGFRLYREQTLLATLTKDSLHYRDYFGVPANLQNYTVKTILEREGTNFYSSGVVVTKTYPTLATPRNVTAIDTLGLKQMRWAYPDGGATGFYILRGGVLTDTLVADTIAQTSFVYQDKTGVSGTVYDYAIRAYSKRNDVTYWSNDYTCLTGLTYPKPLTPTNVAASDGTYASYVKVTWSYPQGADITGFVVLKNGAQIATVNGGFKNYIDLTANGIASYAVRAYKTGTFQGNTYTNNSNLSVADTGYTSQPATVFNGIDFTNITGSNFGRSLAMGNNHLAVGGALGAVNPGRTQLFNYGANTWTAASQLTGANGSFGFALDAAGDELMIGQPANGNYAIYNMGTNTYSLPLSTITNFNWFTSAGGAANSVAISGTGKAVGYPIEDNYTGEVAWVKNGPNSATGRFEDSNYGPNLMGYGLAMNNNYTVVGTPGFGTANPASIYAHKVYIVAADYNTVSIPSGGGVPTFPQPSGLTYNARFGYSVGISRTGTDRIIAGAPGQQGKGAAYIAELANNNWIAVASLDNPAGVSNDQMGLSVAIEGDFAAVGAPGRNGGKGEVYIYQKSASNNSWSLALTYSNPTATADSLGVSLEMSGSFLFMGAPKADAGKGKVYWIDLSTVSTPTVTATQGTINGQTRIDWVPGASAGAVTGFKIYRDGSLLQSVGANDVYFYDANGISGKHYIYEVCSYTAVGENNRKAAEGWSRGNGYLEGKVSTLVGNGGVSGVSIEARATIENNDYIYYATTDANGDYSMSDVYYGDAVTSFALSADFGDHLFLNNPIYTTLSPQQKTRSYLIFSDKTAYTISGIVGRRDATCALDSIHVYGEYVMEDSTTEGFTQDAYTTANGAYSLSINPYKPNAIGLRIKIDSTRILLTADGSDTLHYQFQALQPTSFTSLAGFGQNTTLNYEDTLSYPVRLEVFTACRSAVTGGQFRIRVRSKDDCFDKVYTTDILGKVTAKLPPLQYIMNVDGVVNNTAANQLVIDYLRYRPQTLDVYSLYLDSLYRSSAMVWDSVTHQEFVYHRPPTITVLSGFDRYLCDNPTQPAIIKQGDRYSLRFQVGEIFNGAACVSRTGYLVMKNAAADTLTDTVYVNRNTGYIDPYSFTAGSPNLVAPHRHTLTIEYRTDVGELIASKTFGVIVEGSAALPGSDIIVDLGDNGVQIPMFTLRDPYGDASSSTIAEGSSITREFTISSDYLIQAGLGIELKFTAPVGPKIAINLSGGGGEGKSNSWALTGTTSQAISTMDASDHVGPKNDVIVGAGVALQYGLVQEIKVESCSKITKTQRLGFSPHSIQTTWYYTVAQIEELIRQYGLQVAQVEAGTLVLEEGGKPLSKAAAILRLETYSKNWQKILTYHNKETLPWYNLCQRRPSDIPEPYRSKASEWRNGFCPLVGSYDGSGNFQPKDNLVWDQELVTAYNNAMTAIRVLQEDYSDLSLQELPNWSYYQGALSDPAKFVDEAYVNLHDLQAQNLTYGSGVSIEKSFESAAASSSTFSTAGFLHFDATLGIALTAKAFAGLGFETQLVEGDSYISFAFGFDLNFATDKAVARENTNGISYTLADGDDFDQFSVTVIQGIDPHQTPYFSLLGGRSSCPLELGTIYRDNPKITVYDQTTQSTAAQGTLNFVEPNEPAVFYIQVSNESPFNEERPASITLDPLTNPDGARVTIAGTPMVAGQKLVLTLPPNAASIIPVFVERGPLAYDYNELKLNIKPTCGIANDDGGGENNLLTEDSKSVKLSVHFKNECSAITIAEPDGYWIIQKQNVNSPTSREALPIRLMDYEPSNPNLLDVHLEYRRKAGGDLTWREIPGSILTPAVLQEWNSQNFLASQVPYYIYSWDITGDYATYPDGEYQVRAVAECGLAGRVYSNLTVGEIERNNNLYGLPQPSDRVWTAGDEISVAFNNDLDCATIADSNFVVRLVNDPNSFIPGTVACVNNKLVFSPDLSIIPFYDGDTMEMVIGGVHTFNGNVLDTVIWSFVVISRDLYITKGVFDLEMTQGESADFSTTLVNNSLSGELLSYHVQNLGDADTWLTCSDSVGTVARNQPQVLDFHIDSDEMPIGMTTLSLDVMANGVIYYDAISVSVNVLPAGPDWSFDPSQYSQNMTLISNFNFNNTNIKSTDTTDLISVWIDNKLRGVANINKFTNTLYSAVIAVYGNPADFGKPLKFRIWDASAGIEYDARPDGNNVTVAFASDKIDGSVSSPRLLDVFTASDMVRYIPLNAGWTMFSVNTNNWNAPLNTALSSLRHPHANDVIKTANKAASYVTNSWVSTNGLDSMNVHRGYQIYLQQADTLRITGTAASIRPINLSYGWNLVGYPLQAEQDLDSAFSFLGQPDSIFLKTVAQNPTYSTNMVAIYNNNTWRYTSNSDMDQMYPYFAYKMRVSSVGSQLYYEGANGSAAPVTLLRTVVPTPLNLNKPETWAVNAPDFEQDMIITATIDYDKIENSDEGSKVVAYVGKECRGVGNLVYVPELKRYVTTLMVHSNEENEPIKFYVYDAASKKGYDHYEMIPFKSDSLLGSFSVPYHFSNVKPDNTFQGEAYPNPFNHGFELNLRSDKVQNYQVQLLDLTGRVLLTQNVATQSATNFVPIDTDTLKLVEGVYFLYVKGSLGETLSFKVVHQKN